MKRLLYIAHRLPYPPDKGERLRAYHTLRALGMHYDLTLAAPWVHASEKPYVKCLRSTCSEVVTAPADRWRSLLKTICTGRSLAAGYYHSQELEELLQQYIHRNDSFDVIFCYTAASFPLAEKARQWCVRRGEAPPILIDYVDTDSAKYLQYAEESRWPKSVAYRREAKAMAQLEQKAYQGSAAAIVVAPQEKVLLPVKSKTRVHVMTNGVDCDYFTPNVPLPLQPRPNPSLVFTGQMDYRPNVEAVLWFAKAVWPRLGQERRELEFFIVGRNPTKAVRQLDGKNNIFVTGEVPDTRPFIRQSTICIAPLLMARGIQNKVLEAMAMGKPVVASSAAIEGIGAQHLKQCHIVDSEAQWVAAILTLLDNHALRQTVGQSARHFMEREYRWDIHLQPVVQLCEEVMQSSIKDQKEVVV